VNEWEAKYKALLMAIDNPEYIENAEKLVRVALNLSLALPLTFDEVFYSMRSIIGYEQAQENRHLFEQKGEAA